jgi:hypothetical protein
MLMYNIQMMHCGNSNLSGMLECRARELNSGTQSVESNRFNKVLILKISILENKSINNRKHWYGHVLRMSKYTFLRRV